MRSYSTLLHFRAIGRIKLQRCGAVPNVVRIKYPQSAISCSFALQMTAVQTNKLYMVVEHFKNGDARSVYRRFRERGRMLPDGVHHVSSWVNEAFTRCYQLMETDDRALLDEWIAYWSDLIDFEVQPVMTSEEAVARM